MKSLERLSWLTFEWGLFLYLVFGSMVSLVLPLSDFLRSFLALPSWVILPYFVGGFISGLFRLKFDFKGIRKAGIFSFFLGIYSIVVLAFTLKLLSLFLLLRNFVVLLLMLSFLYLAGKTWNKSRGRQLSQLISPSKVAILISCVVVGAIPALISRFPLPFPYGTIETISIPMEQYQPTIRLLETGYMQLPRIYDSISLAFGSTLFGVDPLAIIWSSSFLMMAIYSTGLFLFAYALSRNRGLALFVASVGSFINLYPFRDAPFLFRSNVFLYVLFPILLYLVYENISKKEYDKRQVVVAVVFLYALYLVFYFLRWNNSFWQLFVPKDLLYPNEWYSHIWLPSTFLATVLGFPITIILSKHLFRGNSFLKENRILLLVLIFSLTAFMNQEDFIFVFFVFSFVLFSFLIRDEKGHIISRLLSLLTIGLIVFQRFIYEIPISSPITRVLAPSLLSVFDIYSFTQRFIWLIHTANKELVVFLFLVGATVLLLSKKRTDALALSMLSLALVLYFAPEQYTYRVFKQLSMFMAYSVGVGFIAIHRLLITGDVFGNNHKRRTRNPVTHQLLGASLFSLLAVLLLVPSLVSPIFERSFVSEMSKPMVSSSEFEAAMWLRQNTPEYSVIISDYATMQLLAPLADKLMLTAKSWRAEDLNQYDQQTYWLIKNNVLTPLFGDEWSSLNSSDTRTRIDLQNLIQRMHISEATYSDATGIPWRNSELLLVLSDRTIEWIRQSDISAISYPSGDSISPVILEQVISGKPALSLDGYESYVEIANSSFADLSSEFTLEIWFKPSLLHTNNVLLSQEYDSKVTPFNFVIDSNGLVALSYYNGSWNGWNTGRAVITETSWYHLAISYSLSSGFVAFFVNGEEVASYANPVELPSNNAPLRIGRYQSSFGAGLVYLVRIYDRALTQKEIHQNYDFQEPTAEGSALWLNLDEGSGNIAQDRNQSPIQGHICGALWVHPRPDTGYSLDLIYSDGEKKIYVFKLQQR